MDERSIRDIILCELFAYNILVHVMAYTRLNRTKLLLLLSPKVLAYRRLGSSIGVGLHQMFASGSY